MSLSSSGADVFTVDSALSLSPAYTVIFTVDSTFDAIDISPGDGACDDGTGSCTLRAAIQEANAFVGHNTIGIPFGVFTLTLGSELTIDSGITLNGAGMGRTIVQAAAAPGIATSRVFNVVAGTHIVITDMTIRHGVSQLGFGGSGIAIQNATATLERMEVVGNTSPSFGAIYVSSGKMALISSDVHDNNGWSGQGGGIANLPGGIITVRNSTVVRNNAGFGAGIYNRMATLTMVNSTVAGNSAGYGGGIGNSGGSAELINSAVLMNTARTDGGGILNQGTLTVIDSVIAGNESGDDGGGVYNQEGVFTLTRSTISGNSGSGIVNLGGGTVIGMNSTVSGNSSSSTRAGGILNFRGDTTLINCTVVGNESTRGTGGVSNSSRIWGTVSLTNTIVAANSSPISPDCSDSITSLGYNIVGNALNCNFNASVGDALNVDPLLGPLADNGGPTETHALLPGSPAIDATDLNCSPPVTDQRGIARPNGTACDIGAYEAESY